MPNFSGGGSGSGGGGSPTTPGGSTKQIQFNDAGAFAGDAQLLWDKTAKKLTLGPPSVAATTTLADFNNASTLDFGSTFQFRGTGTGSTPDENTALVSFVAEDAFSYQSIWTNKFMTNGQFAFIVADTDSQKIGFGSGDSTFAHYPELLLDSAIGKASLNADVISFIGVNAAPTDGALAAGEIAFWFDKTNGAAKLMLKAKQADGTVKTAAVALA